MKKLQCETCGGTEIKKIEDDLFECQNCGVQYSTAEVKKLFVEISGAVAIDKSNEMENLLIRAEEFYSLGDKEKAIDYCNRVLDIDASNQKARDLIKVWNDSPDEPNVVNLSCVPDNSILLFSTKTCPNCKVAASLLDKAGMKYSKIYVEDNPDFVKKLGLKQAPTLVVKMAGKTEIIVNVKKIKKYIEA